MFKINIAGEKGKTYKVELETEGLDGKQLHDVISGKEILPALEGYEFEITGASDKAGFSVHEDADGIGLKKVLLTYGKTMKKHPRKEGKKKRATKKPKGLRLRKTVRGKVISPVISQINLVVKKQGPKSLTEIFPDQNKSPEAKPEEKTEDKNPEEKKSE